MDIEPLPVYVEKLTTLYKVDLYGKEGTGTNTFDMREELEVVGVPLPSCKVDAVYLYFQHTGDIQNVALQGIKMDYKKVPEDAYFDSYDHVAPSVSKKDKTPDIAIFDDGEYIKGIELTITGNNKIGAVEFRTTKSDPQNPGSENKILLYGVQSTQQNEDSKQNQNAPPGEKKKFDFYKDNTYLVGFYGEYDDNYITYLGAYTATFSHINYYSRRPYILMYKKILKEPGLLDKISNDLGFERDENNKVKGSEGGEAKLSDSSTRIFYYLLDASKTNPDLFRTVIEYLY